MTLRLLLSNKYCKPSFSNFVENKKFSFVVVSPMCMHQHHFERFWLQPIFQHQMSFHTCTLMRITTTCHIRHTEQVSNELLILDSLTSYQNGMPPESTLHRSQVKHRIIHAEIHYPLITYLASCANSWDRAQPVGCAHLDARFETMLIFRPHTMTTHVLRPCTLWYYTCFEAWSFETIGDHVYFQPHHLKLGSIHTTFICKHIQLRPENLRPCLFKAINLWLITSTVIISNTFLLNHVQLKSRSIKTTFIWDPKHEFCLDFAVF